MLVHTEDKPIKCTLCTKSFIKNEYLTDHIRRIHNNAAQCPVCKLETPKEELQAHMRELHKPLPCSICNKSFFTPRLLKRHKKSHERPPCKFCSKEIPSLKLRTHISKVHPKELEAWEQMRKAEKERNLI